MSRPFLNQNLYFIHSQTVSLIGPLYELTTIDTKDEKKNNVRESYCKFTSIFTEIHKKIQKW
jgi:hypothetical protein